MKYFRSISLFSVVALSGCGEPSYEQCIRDAVEDGKSEYGIKLLRVLCEEASLKRVEIRDKKCFAELTNKFGEAAVQSYKEAVASQDGRCDPSVEATNWVDPADAAVESAIPAMDAADAAVEGAATAQ